MVLNSDSAVRAFSHGGNVTIGGGIAATAGPIGTGGQISGSLVNPAPIFSYSRSKGELIFLSMAGFLAFFLSVRAMRLRVPILYTGAHYLCRRCCCGTDSLPGPPHYLTRHAFLITRSFTHIRGESGDGRGVPLRASFRSILRILTEIIYARSPPARGTCDPACESITALF